MLTRLQGGLGAVVVTLVTCALVICDITDAGFRKWWVAHALTTDTVAGMLVLLITVLVIDQVVMSRQIRDRSRAVGAQAIIVMGQASRSTKAISSALDGSGDRGAATDEVRTYMLMLLVGAPVLIDERLSRNFLELAQHLGGEMVKILSATAKSPGTGDISTAKIDDSLDQLRVALTPLLRTLNSDELLAAGVDGMENRT